MTTDYPRGYTPSAREAEYYGWVEDLLSEARAEGFLAEVDGRYVTFKDDKDNVVDEFEFESVLDRPELTRS